MPDPSVSVGIVVSGKCVAGGSVLVVVSPLISRMEDQCKILQTCNAGSSRESNEHGTVSTSSLAPNYPPMVQMLTP